MKIFIVIPAYNEERRIGKTLEEYSNFFENIRTQEKIDYEILVVVNNTTDRTVEVIEAKSDKNKKIKYLNLAQRGKGYAVIQGFKEGLADSSEFIGFVDADLATKPQEFYRLFNSIRNYDGVIASRYVKGAIVRPKQTWRRVLVSRIFNYFIRVVMFLPYRDTQCGAKIFKRSAIKAIVKDVKMSQWAFDVDVLYSLNKYGFKIREVPTVWSDREYSKINFMRSGPKMALGVLRLRILHSPIRKFMKVYDKILKSLRL